MPTEKQLEKRASNAADYVQQHEDNFAGWLTIYTLDGDALPRRTNGSYLQDQFLHMEKAADGSVKLTALHPHNDVLNFK